MKKLIMCLGVVACVAMQLKAEETATGPAGFIMCGKKKLVIVGAAASWNAKKKELNLYLSPYKLTDEDFQGVKRGGMSALGSGKDSPDQKLWGDDCPSAQITIEFSTDGPSLSSATFYNCAFYRFVKKFTANHNLDEKQIPKTIHTLTVKDKRLTLRSRGSEELFGEKYTWDLSLSCPIFDVEEQ